MDNPKIGRYELSAYCAVIAKQFPGKTNSILWLLKRVPKKPGLLLLGFTIAARRRQLRKVFAVLRNIKHMVL
jgi:hypothetical protein